MRKSKLIFILFMTFILAVPLLAQPTVQQEASFHKFNRRGFINNNSLQVNNHEVISNYDGNLMLKYSIPFNLGTELSDELSIVYNANVAHKIFRYYETDRVGNIINGPEWILGYKGIALQTFNFETHFEFGTADIQSSTGRSNYAFSKKEVPLLIPGYHFTNNVCWSNNDYGTSIRDVIRILKSDGSTIILTNAQVRTTNELQSDYITGIYYEEGSFNNGYAKVSLLNPNSIPNDYSRKVEYYPGDGLTYYFEEEIVLYKGENEVYSFSNQTYYRPRILYLKKIWNSVGEYVYFKYKAPPTVNTIDAQYGRKCIDAIISNSVNSTSVMPKMLFNYSPSSSTLGSVRISLWSNPDGLATWIGSDQDGHMSYDADRTFMLEFPSGNKVLSPVNNIATEGRIAPVVKIRDFQNNVDEIVYYQTSDDAELHRIYLKPNSAGTLSFEYNYFPYIPKTIKYYNGAISRFEYYPANFETVNCTYNPKQYDYTVDVLMNCPSESNLKYAARDCFTNFMMKKRIQTSSYNTQKDSVTENYTYFWDETPTFKIDNTPYATMVNNIVTRIATITNVNYNPLVAEAGNRKIRTAYTDFMFSKYDISSYDHLSFEAHSTTKLTKESHYESIDENFPMLSFSPTNTFSKIESLYDIGALIESGTIKKYYNGSFLLTQKTEITQQSDINHSLSNSTYYTYPIVDTLYIDAAQKVDRNLKKVFVSKEVITTPDNLVHENTYKHYGISSITFNQTPYFYKTGLPSSEITKTSSDAILSRLVRNYNDSGNKIGKLATETISTVESRPIIKTYDYDESGKIKSIVDEMRARTDFSYFGSYLMNAKYRLANGTTNTARIDPVSYEEQSLPFNTKISFGNKTYNLYSHYNRLNELQWEVDLNKYVAAYNNDRLGRMTKAILPGTFAASNINDTSSYATKYSYNDVNNLITGKSYINPTTTYNFVNNYDQFGILRKSSVNSTTKNEKVFYNSSLVLQEKDALGRMKTYSYDFMNRPTEIYNGDFVQSFAYTITPGTLSRGTVTVNYVHTSEFTDAESNKVTTYYDNLNRKVAEKIGSNDATLFKYNAINQLEKVVTPLGVVTSYTYDELGFLKTKSSPDDGDFGFKYSRYGELKYKYHLADSYVECFGYDKLGRQLTHSLKPYNSASTIESFLSDSSLNPDTDVTANENEVVSVNIYDDIYDKSLYPFLDQALLIPNEFYPTSANVTNTVGRLALTAYRDKTTGTWKNKVYKYDFLGRIAKEYINE